MEMGWVFVEEEVRGSDGIFEVAASDAFDLHPAEH